MKKGVGSREWGGGLSGAKKKQAATLGAPPPELVNCQPGS